MTARKHRRCIIALATLACLGCSPGDRGALQPLSGAGVTLASTHGLPNDTARLTAGGVIADATGRWSADNQTIEVAYRAGARAAALAIDPAIDRQGKLSPASHAWDRTRPAAGNVYGKPLLGTGPLRLKAGERRIVVFDFANSAGVDAPGLDDAVTVQVPMPDGAVPVRFRLGPE